MVSDTMSEPRHVLAVGAFAAPERDALAEMAQASAMDVHVEAEPSAAAAWLDTRQAVAMLIDGEMPGGEAFAVERRAESQHATLPVLTLNHAVNDLSFAEAFSWGADDVVNRDDPHALVSRLRHLPKEPCPMAAANRGVALVADRDRNRRIVVGRVLRNAGYSVTFAVSGDDVEKFVKESPVELVVTSAGLHASPLDTVQKARELGSRALFIVNCPPRDLKQARRAFAAVERATPTDGFAPAENVLFVSNELGRGFGTDKRTSPRLLFGTTVNFRGAGRESDDRGYSYNISENGLYVRTLAPPDDELVWLELCPPRGERRVRLVGKVAWRRGLGKGEFATVPPGFGVQIVDGAKMDLEYWLDRYRAFAEILGVSLMPAAKVAH
jgi:DNA-binding response OmpR family regulator